MSTHTKPDRASWIQGPSHRCNVPPVKTDRPWRLILLGAPGVGKGTQAELLRQHTGACHLSTGDIFRAAKNDPDPSPAMKEALVYMRRGDLVPDAIVLDIVRERIGCLCCGGGFLLDGFPRTVAQANALQELLTENQIQLDAVLDYRLPIEEIVDRLSGRRTCSGCKAVYHVATRPPQNPNICDHCGGPLIQREDDRPESIRVRMDAYDRSTTPLTDFYSRQGIIISVNADGSPQEVCDRALEALEARVK